MPTNSYINFRDLIEKEKPKKRLTLNQIFHNIGIKLKPKKNNENKKKLKKKKK
tara:strand:+ start:2629 stop:2787 length:159 start_codon:yes stop_codon:yes gene_type:complete